MERIGFADAVARQPETLATTLAAVRAGLGGLPEVVADTAATIGIVGMGASTAAAWALAAFGARSGRAVHNLVASEAIVARPPADWWLAISESGRSPEPIEAIRGCRPSVALTNVPGSPVTRVVDAALSLGGVPDGGVYATGYTSTLAALALLGEHAGMRGAAAGLDGVPDLVAGLLASPPAAVGAATARVPAFVDVVGTGESRAAAAELALLLREAARIPSAVHAGADYLHGPAESLGPDGLLVVFGADPGGLVDRFADRVPVVQVVAGAASDERVVGLPDVPPLARAILEGVVALQFAVALGGRGWEVGSFRYEFTATKLPIDGDDA